MADAELQSQATEAQSWHDCASSFSNAIQRPISLGLNSRPAAGTNRRASQSQLAKQLSDQFATVGNFHWTATLALVGGFQ